MKMDFVEWAALSYLRQYYKQQRDTLAQIIDFAPDRRETFRKCCAAIRYIDKKLREYESEATNDEMQGM